MKTITNQELRSIAKTGNALTERVCNYLLGFEESERVSHIQDIQYGGCSSGVVSDLIYYSDTLEFFKQYKRFINAMLVEYMDNSGSSNPADILKDWDKSDPLAMDTSNQNLLAWFGFEMTIYNIANQLEIDV